MSNHAPRIRYTARGQFPWWGGIVLLAFSLVNLGSLGYYELRLLYLGHKTVGQVSRIERPLSTTFIHVRYQTATEQEAEFRWPLAMRERFEIGQKVPIRYLPERRSLGRILTFYQWGLSLIVKSLLGLACGLAGASTLRRRS